MRHGLAILLASLASLHCSSSPRKDAFAKVTFDVAALDAEGLAGPPGGKRSIDYEFCIPEAREAEVKAIDPTVKTQKAPGRSGCGAGQLLAIGTTHQKNYAQVLERLAALDYVTRITECFYE
jgi:hypothetical protein